MALLAATACDSGLTPRTTVNDLRILAIKAEPPEVQPGETTTVSALVADPNGNGRSLDWVLALCTPDETTGACVEYQELAEIYPDPEVAQYEYASCCARGGTLAPAEPIIEITGTPYTVLRTAEGMLEGLDADASASGVNAQLSLLFCESGVCTGGLEDPDQATSTDALTLSLPPDQSSLAIKRVRVSSETDARRNHNPVLNGILVDGVRHDDGYALSALPGQTYRLVPDIDETSIEAYEELRDGVPYVHTEEPYFSWYGTDGEFDDYYSEVSVDDGAMVWTAPTEPISPDATVFVVIWDRRGGLDWAWFNVSLD